MSTSYAKFQIVKGRIQEVLYNSTYLGFSSGSS